MSKSDVFEAGIQALIFNNTPFTLLGDAAGLLGSAAAGSLFLSLHTADPGEAGTQLTSETAYTGYARVAVARTVGGFTITGSSVSPTANVNFPVCTAGTSTVTHLGIGTSSTGAGKLLYKGALNSSIAVASGVTPGISTATTIVED